MFNFSTTLQLQYANGTVTVACWLLSPHENYFALQLWNEQHFYWFLILAWIHQPLNRSIFFSMLSFVFDQYITQIFYISLGSFHVNSTNFKILLDITDSDFPTFWHVNCAVWKIIFGQIFKLLVNYCPRYRSANFDQNDLTAFLWQSISRVLWDIWR